MPPFPHPRSVFSVSSCKKYFPPTRVSRVIRGWTTPPLFAFRFSPIFHLTTLHPMRKYPSSSDPPVRVPVAYASRRLCDIVRPPGGRLKFPPTIRVARLAPKTRSPIRSGQIQVNPTSGTLGTGWISDFGRQLPFAAPQASGLNSRYLKANQGI